MIKGRHGFIKNLRYFCLIGVIFAGLITIIASCATQVYLVAETDPTFEANSTKHRFLVFTPDDATISDKKNITALKQVMSEKGFRLVTFDEILGPNDILVMFSQGSHLYESSGTLFMPTTSSTSGYIGGTYYTGTTSSMQAIPYTSSSFNYQISIDMYQLLESEQMNHVWCGYLDVKAEDFDKAPHFYISKILDSFGQDKKVHEYWTPPIR